MIITVAVIDTYPPSSSDMPIPIAVVTDLGNNVIYSALLNPKSNAKASMLQRLVNTPDKIPNKISLQFFFNSSSCSYNDTGRKNRDYQIRNKHGFHRIPRV